MRFFDRKRELELLADIEKRSHATAQFTVVTGRRRVGKTSLLLKACETYDFAYLFVERKAEKDLCEGFQNELESRFGMTILGKAEKFTDIFEAIMKESQKRPMTVVIDEFQEFRKINMSIFSGIQKLWDLYKDRSKLNLIVSGSVYTLIQKIFKTRKAALYGRETAFLKIDPFPVSVLKDILSEYNPAYTPEDLLALWAFTGGVAKYVELLMDGGAVTKDLMVSAIVREDSVLVDEGRSVLVEEFEKEYGVYFSILSAIANGKNTRNEISQAIGRDVGGYLMRLEKDYALIDRQQPLFAKESARGAHYRIQDNFFRFWFRFIFKYSFLLQIKGYDKLRAIIERDYNAFSGVALERYFREKFTESGNWTRIGNWWDRKGENEIDLIAENELDGTLCIAEIKRDKDRIDLDGLREKFKRFTEATGKWRRASPRFEALSLDDM